MAGPIYSDTNTTQANTKFRIWVTVQFWVFASARRDLSHSSNSDILSYSLQAATVNFAIATFHCVVSFLGFYYVFLAASFRVGTESPNFSLPGYSGTKCEFLCLDYFNAEEEESFSLHNTCPWKLLSPTRMAEMADLVIVQAIRTLLLTAALQNERLEQNHNGFVISMPSDFSKDTIEYMFRSIKRKRQCPKIYLDLPRNQHLLSHTDV